MATASGKLVQKDAAFKETVTELQRAAVWLVGTVIVLSHCQILAAEKQRVLAMRGSVSELLSVQQPMSGLLKSTRASSR